MSYDEYIDFMWKDHIERLRHIINYAKMKFIQYLF